ncbi:MAG: Hpt domain-containing protein [Lachnospiraceae bacterium]|nr:Hpt domain-containing protein [Lachnospiraceae bacterium]
MTVKDFYDRIGGNYVAIIARMRTDDRICKFLKMYLQDKSYETLLKAMSEEKVKEAFLAAHTLKGVVGNMSFQELSEASVDITEALRSEDMASAKLLLPRVIKEYETVKNALDELFE